MSITAKISTKTVDNPQQLALQNKTFESTVQERSNENSAKLWGKRNQYIALQ
jgi:hypothetical protein